MLGLITVLFCGCMSTPQPTVPAPVLADAAFVEVVDVITPEQLFALDRDMLRFTGKASRTSSSKAMRIDMLAELVSVNRGFEYDNSVTQIASQTYQLRSGNCMSLVVMTAALAKELHLEVEYQLVKSPPIWDRRGGIYLVNDHVNIKLEAPPQPGDWSPLGGNSKVIDFLPSSQVRGYRVVKLSEPEVLARFFSNLAAEHMVEEKPDHAYHYLKQALTLDPQMSAAWNTLGVLYKRQGMEEEAEQVYRYVMELGIDPLHSMHNLAVLLASQGRLTEWAKLHRQIELSRLDNPFYYFDMAEASYNRGNFSQALSQYRKAVKLADYHHEFHFGLSRAYFQLGQLDDSQRALTDAIKLAPRTEKERYQLKLRAFEH
ncbi:tetratricopeptide repeat protein [Ferrimonas sp.]|uniref:tetratricopeptide repeat protein n=1 Tax=Ferrimonas sp. TaxID=2080861 RepID=UPI003A91931C